MPLRARKGDIHVNAFECDQAAWAEVKQTYKIDALRMPCCESIAIPKTSKLGNYFFSHSRRDNCTSAPESPEHIFLKTLISKAATKAGWSVVTEWPETTPEGEKWVADVLCTNGRARIALEVQLSYQTVQELRARQLVYASSGVRAAWFASSQKFKQGYLTPSKEIPFFCLAPFEIGDEPKMQGFDLLVSEFVIGLLSKKLSWKTDPCIYEIHFLHDNCWKCGRAVKQVFGWNIDVYGDSAKTVPNMSTVLSKFDEFISNEELSALGLNVVGNFEKLRGNAPGFPYCNQCIHCGAPQNNHYVMKKIEEHRPTNRDWESSKIGLQKFVSSRESFGKWQYEQYLGIRTP